VRRHQAYDLGPVMISDGPYLCCSVAGWRDPHRARYSLRWNSCWLTCSLSIGFSAASCAPHLSFHRCAFAALCMCATTFVSGHMTILSGNALGHMTISMGTALVQISILSGTASGHMVTLSGIVLGQMSILSGTAFSHVTLSIEWYCVER
jgi:hypothetical protein